MKLAGALIWFMAVACACAFADSEEKPQLGKDDFVSSSISAVFDKVDKITSGEEPIFDKNYKKSAGDEGYTDILGRKMPEPKIRTVTPKPAAAANSLQAVQPAKANTVK